jgi:hypothetical protein
MALVLVKLKKKILQKIVQNFSTYTQVNTVIKVKYLVRTENVDT